MRDHVKRWLPAALLSAVLIVVMACGGGRVARAASPGLYSCRIHGYSYTCLTGGLAIYNPNSDNDLKGYHEVIWMDKNKAPIGWNDGTGSYVLGDGGAMVGGRTCGTYNLSASAYCLQPEGVLQLTPTGPAGPTGPTETLTAPGIALVNGLTPGGVRLLDAMARAGITVRKLRELFARVGMRL